MRRCSLFLSDRTGLVSGFRISAVVLLTGLLSVGLAAPESLAQDEVDLSELDLSELDPETRQAIQLYSQIDWTSGPAEAAIGSNATLQIPAGYKLTGPAGSQLWNQLTENPPDQTVATLMPESEDWFVAFTFDEVGYVKDDEKASLDADAIFTAMDEGTEASNDYRRSQGWGGIHMDSWITEPKYDETTNHLVWAFRLRDDSGGYSANYSMRLLGRRGVMNVLVAAEESQMQQAVAETNQILEGFTYNSGHKYAEFTAGDKVAEYGLTALIAGGGFVAAAKMGLLAKLGKFAKVIVIGILALGSGIWKFLTGRGRQTA